MIEIKKLYIDGSEFKVIDNDTPVFTWSVLSYDENSYQVSFKMEIFDTLSSIYPLTPIWSVQKDTQEQMVQYDGPNLAGGNNYFVVLSVTDNKGKITKPYSVVFTQGKIDWTAKWICANEDIPYAVLEFTNEIDITKEVKACTLFLCGIGYHKAFINGEEILGGVLAPNVSNFTKTCYYEVLQVNPKFIKMGLNDISLALGTGFRGIDNLQMGYKYEFYGKTQITAMIKVMFTDGSEQLISTDSNWKWRCTPYTSATVFGGAVLDERIKKSEGKEVNIAKIPCNVMKADTLEPVTNKKTYAPQSIVRIKENKFIIDFGQNIAGYCCLKLPGYMEEGQTITLVHAEELDEEGELFTAILRDATQTDAFISAGGMGERKWFYPIFTYHGFRYVSVTGIDFLNKEDIYAVSIYNDIDLDSRFTCGSPILDKVHQLCLMTERSNLHGTMTDCPQRDERMGWMNDATVRYKSAPYNFNIGRMFPKIIRDVINEQIDGMITCTAPFMFGARPADPVCSSFLIAGLQSYMFTGNVAILEEAYEPYKAWEQFLLSRSNDFIVDYTYYGDWAGPSYACVDGENARSKETPGELMSTGYSYLNCTLISKIATILGKEDDVKYYNTTADNIKKAFLNKWFNKETGVVAMGSHASQTFALWLNIIPKEYSQKVCDVLKNDLVEKNYQFTTGNLCTRYMLDVLTEYGYVDNAYELLVKDTYPSLGFMIQNEATTVWERFELKKDYGMNSHNHPMYGASDYWFFAYILGIKPTAKAFESVDIKPYFPSKLLSANGLVDTVKGNIAVRWVRRYGNIYVYVDVPFGVTANISLPDQAPITVGSGHHSYMI